MESRSSPQAEGSIEGKAYLLGEDPRVITQEEFERRISLSDPSLSKAKSIVMIQCVGPWDEDPSQSFYCSRICCSVAIKNAIKMKEIHPEASITILYKDMRTYGFKEALYTKAREKGVLFVRFDDKEKTLRLSFRWPIVRPDRRSHASPSPDPSIRTFWSFRKQWFQTKEVKNWQISLNFPVTLEGFFWRPMSN